MSSSCLEFDNCKRNAHLVQHYPDLVLLLPDGLDGLLELVTDVELVGVKQQDDAVSSLSKPGQHSGKIITPAALFSLP